MDNFNGVWKYGSINGFSDWNVYYLYAWKVLIQLRLSSFFHSYTQLTFNLEKGK